MNRRHRWRSRKPRRTPWLPLTLGLLVGVPLALELLAWLSVTLLGLNVESQATPTATEPDPAEAYQLQFLTANGKPYDPLAPGKLLAQRHPLLGYTLVPNQQDRFWTINAQGFRDEEPVPLAKPEGEIRIFVLGESTAFGQLSSSNQVLFSNLLETRLNQRIAEQQTNPGRFQPDVLPYRADQVSEALALPPKIRPGQYRVINGAVPGYGSGNTLAQLIHQISHYDPDILVVMGGYTDLLLPADQVAADIPSLEPLLEAEPLENLVDQTSWTVDLLDRLHQGVNRLYVARIIQTYYLQKPEAATPEPIQFVNVMTPTPDLPLASQLAQDEGELQGRIDRYQENLLQLVYWTSATRKRLFLVIPPEITSRSPDRLTPSEQAIVAKLGEAYVQEMPGAYAQLGKAAETAASASANAKVLNFYPLYQSFEEPAFQSPVSLTDAAQGLLSDRLYEAIETELALQPQPFSGGF